MTDLSEQIKAVENEIRETPYHKATERHIGILRARLSRLKEAQIEKISKRGGKRGGYAVKKQGDGTVVLVGAPSVGKSTLLNTLTNAKSKIAPYEFTTVTVIPGMMNYRDAKIQILDVPGLIEGAEKGRGKGREVLSVARGADLLILISDVDKPEFLTKIEAILYDVGIRINRVPPMLNVNKKVRGGLVIHSNIKQAISKETIIDVAKQFRFTNAEITIKDKLTMEQLIDVFSKNRVYVPAIFMLNKLDLKKHFDKSNYRSVDIAISAKQQANLNELKELIWDKLKFVKVYSLGANEKPSKKNPIIMKQGETLLDVARKIGEEFAETKEKAKIWESGAKYPAQEVSLSTKVEEGMQIRFV